MSKVMIDSALLEKYNTSGPRYTSYPTALGFKENDRADILACAALRSANPGLSLYLHIPFCHSLCYYCGCNKLVTRQSDKADKYLDYLEREIIGRSAAFSHTGVAQIHLGGGSPSFLSLAQHARLRNALKTHFRLNGDVQMSIEIDPRKTDEFYIAGLAKLGYTRLSIGVQDIDYRVQEAINRVQSTQHIFNLMNAARQAGFTSVNLDLIYGLPHQTAETFASTLTAVKAMQPERISLFSYAHLPERFAAQRKIKDVWLPEAKVKSNLMLQAIRSLTSIGYEMIGMDHFALPEDELAKAQRDKVLHRNFQGYTTRGDLDLLGLGVSAISAIGDTYGQNPKILNAYYEKLDNGGCLTEKACQLSFEDRLRRDVIQSLMCNLQVDISVIESQFELDFASHFSAEIDRLKPFVDDGLVSVSASRIEIHPAARLLMRAVAMCFDAYLSHGQHQRYSRVI